MSSLCIPYQEIWNEKNDVLKYTENQLFVILLDNTVGSCGYNRGTRTINFVVHIEDEDRYVLYSLKAERHHTVCSTIYALRKETLKYHYTKNDFKLFKKSYQERIERYITN